MESTNPGSAQRFAGRAGSGKRYVGFVAAQSAATSKASIPSKFETVLNRDNHENVGFGRRTYRFDAPENDLPGPGSYGNFSDGISTKKSTLSFSRAGTASFASGKKTGFRDDAPLYVSPGPGSYDTFVKKKEVTHLGPTSVFSTPTWKRPVARSAPLAPGPGSYDVVRSESSMRKVPCSAMSSRCPKDPSMGKALPVSSFLDIESSTTFKTVDRTNVRPLAGMRSSTDRFKYNGPLAGAGGAVDSTGGGGGSPKKALPPLFSEIAQVSALTKAPKLVQESLPEDPSPKRRGSSLPVSSSAAAKQKASPMFANTILDRFGRPTVRYTAPPPNNTGPGCYEVEKPPKKMLISSSWAVSAVPRDTLKDRYQPPGPAFYNVGDHTKQVSHRVNVGGWSA